ncbi:MAG: hypothetical protein IPK60_22075 [Sandaracinaceae bacterium]|nr:hypothetical protein [Sandaracinaceae bacterium]
MNPRIKDGLHALTILNDLVHAYRGVKDFSNKRESNAGALSYAAIFTAGAAVGAVTALALSPISGATFRKLLVDRLRDTTAETSAKLEKSTPRTSNGTRRRRVHASD